MPDAPEFLLISSSPFHPTLPTSVTTGAPSGGRCRFLASSGSRKTRKEGVAGMELRGGVVPGSGADAEALRGTSKPWIVEKPKVVANLDVAGSMTGAAATVTVCVEKVLEQLRAGRTGGRCKQDNHHLTHHRLGSANGHAGFSTLHAEQHTCAARKTTPAQAGRMTMEARRNTGVDGHCSSMRVHYASAVSEE